MSDVRFEREDANPWTIAKFALGLFVTTIVVAAVLVWFLVLARRREQESDPRRPALYYSDEQRKPQGVPLQTTPFADVQALRQREHVELTTYGWVDEPAGVVRIPIDRAMDLYAERQAKGAGTWPPQDAANPPDQPTDAAPVPAPQPASSGSGTAPAEHGGEK